jgi:hypothetical protein
MVDVRAKHASKDRSRTPTMMGCVVSEGCEDIDVRAKLATKRSAATAIPTALPPPPRSAVGVAAKTGTRRRSATPTPLPRILTIIPRWRIMVAIMCSSRPPSPWSSGRIPRLVLGMSCILLLVLSVALWEEAPPGACTQSKLIALMDDQACSLDRPAQRRHGVEDMVPAAPDRSASEVRRAGSPLRPKWSPLPSPCGGVIPHGTTRCAARGGGTVVRDAVRGAGVGACGGSQ